MARAGDRWDDEWALDYKCNSLCGAGDYEGCTKAAGQFKKLVVIDDKTTAADASKISATYRHWLSNLNYACKEGGYKPACSQWEEVNEQLAKQESNIEKLKTKPLKLSIKPQKAEKLRTLPTVTDSKRAAFEKFWKERGCFRPALECPGFTATTKIVSKISDGLYEIAAPKNCSSVNTGGPHRDNITSFATYGEHALLKTNHTSFETKGALPLSFAFTESKDAVINGRKVSVVIENNECTLAAEKYYSESRAPANR
jgi:hypothetical protein